MIPVVSMLNMDDPANAEVNRAAAALFDATLRMSEAVEATKGEPQGVNAMTHGLQCVMREAHTRGVSDTAMFSGIAAALSYFIGNQGLGPPDAVAAQLGRNAYLAHLMASGAAPPG